jgi:hypothetical protein
VATRSDRDAMNEYGALIRPDAAPSPCTVRMARPGGWYVPGRVADEHRMAQHDEVSTPSTSVQRNAPLVVIEAAFAICTITVGAVPMYSPMSSV